MISSFKTSVQCNIFFQLWVIVLKSVISTSWAAIALCCALYLKKQAFQNTWVLVKSEDKKQTFNNSNKTKGAHGVSYDRVEM